MCGRKETRYDNSGGQYNLYYYYFVSEAPICTSV